VRGRAEGFRDEDNAENSQPSRGTPPRHVDNPLIHYFVALATATRATREEQVRQLYRSIDRSIVRASTWKREGNAFAIRSAADKFLRVRVVFDVSTHSPLAPRPPFHL